MVGRSAMGCCGNSNATREETTMRSFAAKMLVLIWMIGLFFSVPLHAQVAGGTLTGTITDAQGGAVANAKVSAKNAATGITTDTTTNAAGNYNLVNLKPADYVVTVQATGFATSTTKVTLTVGAQQELSLALKVGEMSQLVEVTGAAPVIETENATLSGNVQSAQIVELPLNGRDWTQLATLEMSQLVEVTGAAPVIETENATLSGNVQSAQIVELPLNGRDWTQLATLET